MAANLKMFRYLFAHETAVGLLTLAGVPHPNHYGAQWCNYPYLCSLLEITLANSPNHLKRCVPIMWQYLPFYTVFSLSLWPILYIEMKKSFTPLIPCQGVCHGDELALLYLPLALSSSGDRQMSRMMVDWWSNFAKHGWEQGQQDHQWWRYHRRLSDYQSPNSSWSLNSWGFGLNLLCTYFEPTLKSSW